MKHLHLRAFVGSAIAAAAAARGGPHPSERRGRGRHVRARRLNLFAEDAALPASPARGGGGGGKDDDADDEAPGTRGAAGTTASAPKCKGVCAKRATPLSVKCGWRKCRGCAACGADPPAGCKWWCKKEVPWSRLCKKSFCAGCGECVPSAAPASRPSTGPSLSATGVPTSVPSQSSAIPTSRPSAEPSASARPSSRPSTVPTRTGAPTSLPSPSPSAPVQQAPPAPPASFLHGMILDTWDAVQCTSEDEDVDADPTVAELALLRGALVLTNLSVCQADLADASSELTVSGAATFRAGADAPPLALHASGAVAAHGASSLDVRAAAPWLPLPSLLSDFAMPELAGGLVAAADGNVTFQVTAAKIPSFSLSSVVEFKDWVGSLSVEAPDAQVQVGAVGTMAIGGAAGFSVNAVAEFDLAAARLAVQATHDGGWKPFPSLLPSFASPEFSAALDLASDGHVSFEASADHPSPIVLFDPSVVLRGKDGAAGPRFRISLSQEDSDAAPAFGAFFEAVVTVPFGSLIDLSVTAGRNCPDTTQETSAEDADCSFGLIADYTAGDISPLSGVLASAATSEGTASVGNVFTLHANEDTPASFTLEVSPSPFALTFGVSASFSVDLGNWGTVSGSVEGAGTLADGRVDGHFLGKLDALPPFASQPPFDGLAGPMYASVATEEVSAVLPPGESWSLDVPAGLALSYSGPSMVPLLCDEDMVTIITYPSLDSMALSAECSLELETSINALGINHLAFRTLTIKTDVSPSSVSFGITGDFEMATTSSVGSSDCQDPDAEFACLTVDLVASIAMITLPVPSTVIDFNAPMRGTWVEPLGLPNFALARPSVGLGIEIFAIVTVPKRFEWGNTIYWKRTGNWPDALLAKQAEDEHPCPDGPDGSPGKPLDCFGSEDLVAMGSHYVYETMPHDDDLLSSLALPRLGSDVVVTDISLFDMLRMGVDIASWIAKLSGNDGDIAPIEYSAGADLFLKEVKFGFHLQLSLIEGGIFQRGLYLYGTAQSDFADFGSFYFMLEVELRPPSDSNLVAFTTDPLASVRSHMLFNATVTLPTIGDHQLGEAIFYGGISVWYFYMSSTITIGPIAGFNFDFQAFIHTGESGLVTGLSGSVELGDLGYVGLQGSLSSNPDNGLAVDGSVDINLGGINVDGVVEVRLNTATQSVLIKGDIPLGILGGANVMGTVDSVTGHASYSMAIDYGLFGFRVCGQLYSNFEQGQYLLSASLVYRLGFLGVYYLVGTISNDGVYLHASGQTGGAIGDGIAQAIKDGFYAILDEVDSDILDAIADALLSFELESMIFTLDTRSTSTNKKAMLHISINVLGETMGFSVQIGLDRRRRVLKSSKANLPDIFNNVKSSPGGQQPPIRAALGTESPTRRLQLTEDELDEMCPEGDNPFTVEDFINAMKDAFDADRLIGFLLNICPELGSSRGCEDTEFCNLDFQCTPKLDNGDPCFADNACQSDACLVVCVECNRHSQCNDDEFCNLLGSCSGKNNNGEFCIDDGWCKSGICNNDLGAGLCADCKGSGHGCSSDEYCLLGDCVSKYGFGHVCAFDYQCSSDVCHLLQCSTNSCTNHPPCIFGYELDVCGQTKCCNNEPQVCFPEVCVPGNCWEVCIPFAGCHDVCSPQVCTPAYCIGEGGVNCNDCC